MTAGATLVVVGGSLAGVRAAEGARDAGFDGRIVVVGDEPTAPYERPPLSKAVLRGEDPPESAQLHPADWYRDLGVELVTERAVRVDTLTRVVELARGDELRFDRLVLATGAWPRRLSVAGAELDGVHHLRTVDDAVRLRDAIRGATRVAVVGAGWIGTEVAASARQVGADVVVIDPGEVPLQRVLGDRLGGVFRDLHADHGVELRFRASVAELRGTRAVEAVVLDDGRVEPADVVVAGIGVLPNTELADGAAGVRVQDGIVVDQYLETSVHGLFAAGDVANAWDPAGHRHRRVEHWANALNQGFAAGRNAAGAREPYARLPYFYSDQFDLGLEYVGHHGPDDLVTVRGDVAARELIAFWQRDGVVTAAMTVNVWDVIDDLKAIVESGRPVGATGLADPDVPLPTLLAA